MAVAILRMPNGMDFSHLMPEMFGNIRPGMQTLIEGSNDTLNQFTMKRRPTLLPSDSNLNLAAMDLAASDPNLVFATNTRELLFLAFLYRSSS
jgi:hypothetical protein